VAVAAEVFKTHTLAKPVKIKKPKKKKKKKGKKYS